MIPTEHPTKETYGAFQRAFRHFNRQLFRLELPEPLITVQRHYRAYGYFSSNRFVNSGGILTDEIALNPMHFADRTVEAVLATLVHEMCHLWQHHFGRPSRNGYHNKEWAFKMREVGLIPSASGQPGGKTTGQNMSHYIEMNGRFAIACKKLTSAGFAIEWVDRLQTPFVRGRSTGRDRYHCPKCGQNAWAKPKAKLICGNCRISMPWRDPAGATVSKVFPTERRTQ